MTSKIFIETSRLILRSWQDSDIPEMIKINNNPTVMEHFPALMSQVETRAFVTRIKEHFVKYNYGLFAVELKDSGKFIGFVGLNKPTFKAHFTPCVEIGWRLSDKYWGKGYATEAAKAVLEYGFNTLKLDKIFSFTVPANLASRKVMEKIGMIRDTDGDFLHPHLPEGHKLSTHVLYVITPTNV